MRRKFEELGEVLDEFVSQVEYPALVIECGVGDVAYVTMQLQALEQTHPEAWVLIFAAPFSSSDQYVDSIVELLLRHVEAADPLRQQRGEPPFASVPTELADRSRPAAARLRAVLDYLRSLLPNENENVLAIGLLPAECSDAHGYTELVASVLPIGAIEPWMLPLRMVVYDDRAQPILRPLLDSAESDTVLMYSIDFSVPALTDALVRSAADTSLPSLERMASLLQLAMIDHTDKRYAPALERFGVLHNYYEEQHMPELQAMCLHGAGDVLLAGGQPEAAKGMFQRGITLALEHSVLPVLLNLLVSIVEACLQLSEYHEAETYAESGMMVAARTLNPYGYADLDEKKGDGQLAQGKVARALSTYRHCAETSQNNGYFARCKSALGKRVRVYEDAGMKRQRDEAEAELALVEDLERNGDRAPQPAKAQRPPSRSRAVGEPASLGAGQ